MAFWTHLPASGTGWALWLAGLAAVLLAVATVLRGLRGRRPDGWTLAALAFVILGGPGAALAFLAVHAVLERRALRRTQVAGAR